jgi:ADP-ribose pyrophosphatase YjhB (NUDIX family)
MSNTVSANSDRPRITVAAIVERDGQFLFVEERDNEGRLVINQPAGHLEIGESLPDAVIREAFEETAWRVRPDALVGIYIWGKPDRSVTYLRVAIAATALEEVLGQVLDEGIEQALWLTREELLVRSSQHRSPLVLQCVDDYLSGSRHSLGILKDFLP